MTKASSGIPRCSRSSFCVFCAFLPAPSNDLGWLNAPGLKTSQSTKFGIAIHLSFICVNLCSSVVPFLLIAGATENESQDVIDLAKSLLPQSQFKILLDMPKEDMPELYHVMDVFALCSLEEMFGICFIEAMASGVPCIGHRYPVTEWMLGVNREMQSAKSEDGCSFKPLTINHLSRRSNGQTGAKADEPSTIAPCVGACVDMSKEGELAKCLAGLTPEWIEEHGKGARKRAEEMFSKDVVIKQYIEYYKRMFCTPVRRGGLDNAD
ncbi:glycosyltransferase [Verrucomicrobiota bacterium]